jgi:hypothetical protein
MGEKRNAYRVSVEKPERKSPVGRARFTWESNIKMDIRKIGQGGMDWIHLVQDRDQWKALVNTIMNLRVCWMVGHKQSIFNLTYFTKMELTYVYSEALHCHFFPILSTVYKTFCSTVLTCSQDGYQELLLCGYRAGAQSSISNEERTLQWPLEHIYR